MLLCAATFAASIAAPACGSSEGRECRIGADCASGQCTAEGTCVRVQTGTPDADAPSEGGPAPVDGGLSLDAPYDANLPGCTPNKDGTITRDEVPITAGLQAKYRVGTNEDVSTAGNVRPDGKRDWDYTGALGSDVTALVETLPLAGKWYAAKYPGATYATKLRESTDLLGIFETSPGALLLRGVVSPDDNVFTKTELQNAPGVPALKFPLKMGGEAWSTTVDVSGVAQGVTLFGSYREVYDSVVDAEGDLKTPLGTFKVLRVKTKLVRTIGVLAPVTIRSFAFVTECYGTIALVTSADNEANEEFTRAVEIRRIAP